MRDAVIVSTARTPIGKAYRGAFNNTTPQALAAHAIENAVKRAGVDPAGATRLIMISDDNFFRIQRTQIVEYVLSGSLAPPG